MKNFFIKIKKKKRLNLKLILESLLDSHLRAPKFHLKASSLLTLLSFFISYPESL